MDSISNKNKFKLIFFINIIYAFVVSAYFYRIKNNNACVSFLSGWLVAVINLELLRRLGALMLPVFEEKAHEHKGQSLPQPKGLVIGLVFIKFLFLGIVLMLLSTASWIQGGPFILGAVTIVIASLGLGLKEYYARTT